MNALSHSPFLKALGWALLNNLWQFGVIWLLFALIIHSRKNLSPALKHGAALLLMSAGFIWFAVSLCYHYFSFSDTENTVFGLYQFAGNNPYTIIYSSVQSFLENNLAFFSLVYLLIVAGFFIRFFRFFFHAHSLQARGLNKIRAELRLYVQQLVQQLNIGHNVQVWVSEYIDTPMVMGFLKPTILIPIACINQLTVKQLEAILLHELAHIKRNDYLVNLYIATMEILFFFNPFARLLIRSIKQEREKSCDDWVLQFRFDPYQYASALLALEQSRASTYSLAIAATGDHKNLLLQRIQRIMGIQKPKTNSGFKLLAYFLTISLLCFIALVNPADIVVKNLDYTFSGITSQESPLPASYYRISYNKTASSTPIKPEKNKNSRRKKEIVSPTPVISTEKDNADELKLALTVSQDEKDRTEIAGISLLQSISNENRNFSIKEKDPPPPPEAAATNEFPFVPNSSYSYYIMDDSSHAKIKKERNSNPMVRQSLVQAQKAIEKLDWNRIGKLQNISKTSLQKLRKEIESSLRQLNWQQIYKEAMDSVTRETTDNMKITLKTEVDMMNHYKKLQQQYEAVKTELQQQQEKFKNGAEMELKEIQKQVKKHKVIVEI